MDAERFDALTRSLPGLGTRRRTLMAALGGLLGLVALQPSDVSAAKSCKGLKGKKKKKCLKKARKVQCRKDGDCLVQAQSCQRGRCRPICPTGACPGCNFCFVRHESDGSRSRRCAGSADVPSDTSSCHTDEDCPASASLCLSAGDAFCDEGPCGVCVTSTGPCEVTACANDEDCTDEIQSCQGGLCGPVCPTGACSPCDFCLIHFEADGDRTRLCADSILSGNGPVACTTDADCPAGDAVCIGVICDTPPCRQCLNLNICTP